MNIMYLEINTEILDTIDTFGLNQNWILSN